MSTTLFRFRTASLAVLCISTIALAAPASSLAGGPVVSENPVSAAPEEGVDDTVDEDIWVDEETGEETYPDECADADDCIATIQVANTVEEPLEAPYSDEVVEGPIGDSGYPTAVAGSNAAPSSSTPADARGAVDRPSGTNAAGGGGSESASAVPTYTAASAHVPAAELPFTGAEQRFIALAGTLLLLAGAGMHLAARRS